MTEAVVSVIIPAHGHAGMTRACTESVLDTVPPSTPIEVVVVDDASMPPLAESAEWDPRVRIVRSEANLRFAGACNLGAAKCNAPNVLFLNNDVTPEPGWLEAMLACVNDGADMVGIRLEYADGTVQHAGICFSQADGMPRHVYRGFPGDHPAVVMTRDMQAVTAACFMTTRSAFEAVGGFDEGFVNGFEDVDLCLRASAMGSRIVYCGGAVARHLESVSVRLSPEQAGEIATNAARFRDRWPGTHPDEIQRYVADGLLRIDADDIYPLTVAVDPLLGVPKAGLPDDISRLLNIRSRQVFDLEKDVGRLAAQLLDHGIEPSL